MTHEVLGIMSIPVGQCIIQSPELIYPISPTHSDRKQVSK